MWIDELAELMPPPAIEARGAIAQTADWERAEVELGVKLPADYRAFLDRWGAGSIGPFMHPYTPAAGFHPVITLPSGVTGEARAYASLKENHPASLVWPVYPAHGSLMSFAVTDNGDYVGWLVGPGDPNDWPVAVVDDEYGNMQVFDGLTFGPFLLGVVTGRIRPEAFPDDLWNKTPLRFSPSQPQEKFLKAE
ncbi:SMI1/KNR4 family protein [Paracoccus laeviglucosivorans]|uniref:SMI1-KNR4 cell-wall n=1 Tax=Paracoccus laeviglucosivorans TaxID=1197861 RepID=A0A521BFD7_9RHOB|nr:SMI1/KNR4 family protein [Paracoccus laeviglucosivorans]SMO45818.1 SMI1-KNR4 cell-wall [Paracoccus laeviglucosivorans]